MTLTQNTRTISFRPLEISDFLPELDGLFETLNEQEIRYCHWKSNVRLDQSLMGKTDLDLLIDPADADRFETLLAARKIKRILAPAGKEYPGLEHYLGFDALTGRLFHLHVHYKLVLGEQFVKNYHLPLEKIFLDSVYLRLGVKIPIPELELIVLTLRALLKYRDRDVVKDVLGIRSPGIPQHILDEFDWLLGQASLDSVASTLATLPTPLPSEAILEFLKIITSEPRSGMNLFRLRSQVQRALTTHQRQERIWATAKYLQELWRRRSGWRLAPEQKMTLPGRGLTIALVGVDGSGKSTMSKEVSQWLRWKLETPLYYLGSKEPSLRSKWLYTFFRMARRTQRELSLRIGKENPISKLLTEIRQALLYCHHLSIGHDRLQRYLLSQKKVKAGAVVIFDRFPFKSPLDGPEIPLVSVGFNRFLSGFFSRQEKAIYQRFGFPDFLILLDVSPHVSLQRKPDHSAETIAAKKHALDLLQKELSDVPGKNWETVDADADYATVLLQIKHLIWAQL